MWNEKDNEIMMMWNGHCTSAEWPAVIYIHTCRTIIKDKIYTLSDKSEKKVTLSDTIPELYTGISRARVYSATIMRDYNATNICKYDEQLIEELKQRRDVCRIVEVETPQNPSESDYGIDENDVIYNIMALLFNMALKNHIQDDKSNKTKRKKKKKKKKRR